MTVSIGSVTCCPRPFSFEARDKRGDDGCIGFGDRLAIAARDDEESLADGGGSVITSAQFAPFDDVGKFAELPYVT
jgi:hypothetical protein